MTAVAIDPENAAYSIAVQELPVRAELAVGVGSIAVVSGERWRERLGQAEAPVVIVAGDVPLSGGGLSRIPAPGSAVVIFERARLRRDVVDDALAARAVRNATLPRLVVAECTAAPADLCAAVRDALGWSRELAGGLALRRRRADPRGLSALLAAGPGGIPVVLRATVAPVPRPFLRVTAVGEVTSEVTVDELGGRRSVTTSDRSGRTVAPSRFETVERFTLRRAIAALAEGGPADDLTDLLADVELAERVLGE